MAPVFGQVVLGPPGSGKTTYCVGAQQYLTQRGRNVAIINLDPANDGAPYKSNLDIRDLIQLSEVMSELDLGPNGALLYCMEFLESNIDWLYAHIEKLSETYNYFLIDCPGQVELYTHHNAVRLIVSNLSSRQYKLTAVHLVDAHYCSDPFKFVSVLLTSLSTMIKLELPHVNVLSKLDIMEKFGKLAFGLDFYTDVSYLDNLFHQMNEDPFMGRFQKLNEALAELVTDYSLVAFIPLSIEDVDCMRVVTSAIDKANGWIYGGLEDWNRSLVPADEGEALDQDDLVQLVEERYLSGRSGENEEDIDDIGDSDGDQGVGSQSERHHDVSLKAWTGGED